MKWHRKLMFAFGKALKYTFWAASVLFFYHLAIIKKYQKPEEMPVVEPFLSAARNFDWFVYDMRVLMTKPAMTKMLPDKIPGMQYPKTLVVGFNGTLVHRTYSLGVGSEMFKRPGLSAFLIKMA